MAKQRPVSPEAERLNKALGAAIHGARRARGLSQQQLINALAEILGEPPGSNTTVSDYERAVGQIPLAAVVDIENALKLPRGSLLEEAGYVERTHGGADDILDRIRRDQTITPDAREMITDLYVNVRRRMSGQSAD
jgi:transcriptional regulator with XRE-family HTH domain